MGEVYRATDTRLDRTVAIKVLPAHVADDSDLRQRFEREAKTVAGLSHPHICPVFDVGSQDGIDFLVMEYLDGETVAQRLEKGALPLDQALTIAIEIADALDKAHRQGIVHRDLKPANIMLTTAGAKLLDFGLAKPTNSGGASGVSAMPTQSARLTGEGAILGTMQYMAPEQLEGKTVDHRTDIFAFGATVYEMVTGTKAFEADSQASLIAAVLEHEPAPMSSLQTMTPLALDHVVRTCLAKDPEDRWQSAKDLEREVKWVTDSDSTAPTSPRADALYPASWSRSIALTLAASLVVGLLTGLGVWSLTRAEPPASRLEQFDITPQAPESLALAGTDHDIAISPDGTRVVYPMRPSRFFVRTLDELTPLQRGGLNNLVYAPFVSPDSAWIGFSDESDRTLKRVSIQGGTTFLICRTPPTGGIVGASWGPDDTIIFGTDTPSGLWRVSALGGEPEELVSCH